MKTAQKMRRRAMLIFMLDRPGGLNKISMLIRRKMYNVETITACKTHQPGVSRMTLTLREDSDAKMLQVIRQVEKMTEVISARELDIEESYWREVAIVKFEVDQDQLDRLARDFSFEVLDRQRQDQMIVQVAGTSQRIDDFVAAIGRDRVVEVARSGFTALER
jgi:acetolactate synthase-1/3 small subunit